MEPSREPMAGAATALTIAQGAAFAVTGVSLTVGPLALMRHGHGALGGALVAVLGLASGLGAALGGRGMARRPGVWLAAGHALYGCAGALALGASAAGSAAGVVAAVWLIGMGQGIALLGRAVVASMARAQARGRVTGRMLAAGAVGAVAGPLFVELVRAGAVAVGRDPLVAPWILVCLLGLIGLVAVRRAGALPGRAVADRSPRPRPAGLSSRSAVVALAATQATMAGAMAVAPGRIHQMSGAAAVVSIAVAVHLAAMYGAAPFVGRFIDRRGHAVAVATGAGLSAVGAVLVGAPSAGVAAAGLALVGIGWSAAYVVFDGVARRRRPGGRARPRRAGGRGSGGDGRGDGGPGGDGGRAAGRVVGARDPCARRPGRGDARAGGCRGLRPRARAHAGGASGHDRERDLSGGLEDAGAALLAQLPGAVADQRPDDRPLVGHGHSPPAPGTRCSPDPPSIPAAPRTRPRPRGGPPRPRPPRRRPSVAPTASASGMARLVGRTWPEAVATDSAAVAYDRALAGLDPGVVAEVVASLAAKGRTAPPPDILRTVVASRHQAAATLAPAVAPPAPSGSRARPLAAALAAGACLGLASLATRADWMRISEGGRETRVAGIDLGGGPVVAAAGPLALLAAAAGALWLWRRRPVEQSRLLLALLAAIAVAAVSGAMTGVMRVSEMQNRLVFDVGTGEGGVVSGVQGLVAVTTGPAAWAALALSLTAVVAATYGLIAHRGA